MREKKSIPQIAKYLKTEIATKPNYSKWTKLSNSNGDKTQKNLNYDKTEKPKFQQIKSLLVRTAWHIKN